MENKTESKRYNMLKKPGFDQLFEAYKKMVPSLTTLELATDRAGCDNYDDNLVTVELVHPLHDGNLIIHTFEIVDSLKVPTGESTVSFSILMCDLACNLDKIKDLIVKLQ